MIHHAAIIHAMLRTFAKNLYLICCDVPFVFARAWVVQRSHGAKQREHKEIINGDQYSTTLMSNWVKWLSYWNSSWLWTEIKLNSQVFIPCAQILCLCSCSRRILDQMTLTIYLFSSLTICQLHCFNNLVVNVITFLCKQLWKTEHKYILYIWINILEWNQDSSVCACFQNSLTAILAEAAGKGSSLFNYQGYCFALNHLYTRDVPACV